MENYITDSLYFKDKKLYYDDELVDYTNYLEALEDYGFESISDEWAMRLDDNYFLLDCGGDGDCLFHVISEALNLDKISRSNTGKKALLYNAKDIRKIAADSVTRKNFRDIICAYTLAKESDEFIGLWNPSFVETVKDRLGRKSLGRKTREVSGGHELREAATSYIADFDPKKGDIGPENSYNLTAFPELSA